jgi:hypothetical protein
MLGLAFSDCLDNEGGRQAKIDLEHPKRDGEDQVRPGVQNDVRERRKTRAVVFSAGSELGQSNQHGADMEWAKGFSRRMYSMTVRFAGILTRSSVRSIRKAIFKAAPFSEQPAPRGPAGSRYQPDQLPVPNRIFPGRTQRPAFAGSTSKKNIAAERRAGQRAAVVMDSPA